MTPPPSNKKNIRVLLVEDSPDDAELILLELRRTGLEVSALRVDTPEEMQAALHEQIWDVVLCDHAMPRFSSSAAFQLLQATKLDLPFIIVSGTMGEEHAVAAMRAGCHDYVMKGNLKRLAPAIHRELRDADDRQARRRAEEALRSSLQTSAEIVQAIPDGLFIFQYQPPNDLILHDGNPAAQQLTGVSLDQWCGREINDIWSQARDISLTQTCLAAMKSFEPTEDLEIHLTERVDRWYLARTFRLPNNRLGVIFEDITERKRNEEERRRLESQLTQAQKMESLGVLAGGIAHDFNNLLTIIIGNTQYLREHVRNDDALAKALQDIETAAAQASEMTRSLQAFGRPSAPLVQPVNANVLIAEIQRMLRRVIPLTVEMKLDLDPVPCVIAADPGQISQLLINLCINSRDALGSNGRIEIQTHHLASNEMPRGFAHQLEHEQYVRISVADNGSGMDPGVRERIYDPFFTTKPKDRGTGLGLSIVYRTVQNHNGLIDLWSEKNQGTRFDIYFPAIREPLLPEVHAAPSLSRGGERLLVVDDEEMIASLLKTVLENRGYVVAVANQPEDAIDLAANATFDLAVVDFGMPRMNGLDCLARIRESQPELPAILISGYAHPDAEVPNNVHVVTKPFSPRTIADVIRETLDQ